MTEPDLIPPLEGPPSLDAVLLHQVQAAMGRYTINRNSPAQVESVVRMATEDVLARIVPLVAAHVAEAYAGANRAEWYAQPDCTHWLVRPDGRVMRTDTPEADPCKAHPTGIA